MMRQNILFESQQSIACLMFSRVDKRNNFNVEMYGKAGRPVLK